MAAKVPSSFNREQVREGLLTAMRFGEPTRDADKVTFFFPRRADTGQPADQEGVPFDPSVRPEDVGDDAVTVECAVDYMDRSEELTEGAGELKASRILITLLDTEYQQVRDFSYATIGGQRYNYSETIPPVALGTIDVWQVMCTAEDVR